MILAFRTWIKLEKVQLQKRRQNAEVGFMAIQCKPAKSYSANSQTQGSLMQISIKEEEENVSRTGHNKQSKNLHKKLYINEKIN